jgi:DMSO/TMAO reductase YedYZ molybdopterin-dependent catalytic subunit
MKGLRNTNAGLKRNRREFLASPLALAVATWPAGLRALRPEQSGDPLIRTIDFSSLRTLLTPNDEFFLRNHFVVPPLSLTGWKLRVTGRVRVPLELRYADILARPQHHGTITLECAGNGVGSGGISTATWAGVSLGALLMESGLSSRARYVRLVGADRGIEGSSNVPVAFARSIPVEKAMHPDTLLAFRMNGARLPAEHGYPLRAVIPGWYGMDSVKWLIGIEVLERDDESFYMTQRYMAVRLQAVGSEQCPITRMRVKSQIAQPRQGEFLAQGTHLIRGAAWAGENRVAKVEVSTNGGKDWNPASLDKESRPYAWVLWNYPWDVQMPGAYTIAVRATDDRGTMQPSVRDSHRFDSYEENWYHSVHCEVG